MMKKIVTSAIVVLGVAGAWTSLTSWNYIKYSTTCFLGSTEGCAELGFVYDLGDGVDENNSKAANLYQNACDNECARGCFLLGTMYEYGDGVEKNKNKTKQLYKKSCDGNYNKGCYSLGKLYKENKEGNIPYENIIEAKQIYTKLCDNDYARGCRGLGKIYADKEFMLQSMFNYATEQAKKKNISLEDALNRAEVTKEADIKNGKSKAIEYYKKGCHLEDLHSCFWLGNLYREGLIIEKDTFKAFELYKGGCKASNTGCCNSLADMYRDGKGVLQNDNEAKELYSRTCKDGNEYGCSEYAKINKK